MKKISAVDHFCKVHENPRILISSNLHHFKFRTINESKIIKALTLVKKNKITSHDFKYFQVDSAMLHVITIS